MKIWEVYIIETEDGTLYTGITTNLERRYQEHISLKGARFFRTSPPKALLFRERHPNRASASKREAEIKKLSRKEKLKLIKMK
jgi:putative endonuclease